MGVSYGQELFFMPEFIDPGDVKTLSKEMYPDRELYYRPSKEELLSFSDNYYYISKAGLKELADLMKVYSYYGYYLRNNPYITYFGLLQNLNFFLEDYYYYNHN
ncbi:MAG: hypothetical protein IK060_07170, partial [Methanomicrobium sp.]|nr:hypothetical protein [Methanomicrobium sp.]